MRTRAEFDESIIETIDVRLKQIFGDAGTMAIYNYLQSALSLPQEEIPEKLEIFAQGLDRFLSSGAKVVEKVILDGLYSNFGQKFEFKQGYNFADYVKELKTTFR
ncbi:MAG: hypothetical protein NWE81_01135 [Candidatus Bathyarchaeota archaeon]|nr:hypothetical protein [Candidatus Bathyarchaeota archaeon]